jgi:hypothetical protein
VTEGSVQDWQPRFYRKSSFIKFYIHAYSDRRCKSSSLGPAVRPCSLRVFVSRALKSVLVDLSLPKRRALFDFLRDPQFVKSKLTYLFLRTAKRPWTDWHGWNSTIILDFGATSIKWVSRHETMSTKTRCVHKDGQIRSLCFFQKCPSLAGEVSSTPILHEIVNRLTRNHQ